MPMTSSLWFKPAEESTEVRRGPFEIMFRPF